MASASRGDAACRPTVEPAEVTVECFDHALMASCFAGPTTTLGVRLELSDVVELSAQSRGELVAWDEVVAGLADVGVGTGSGEEMARAVAGPKAGLEELRSDPFDLGRDRRSPRGGDRAEVSGPAPPLVLGS